MASDTKPTDTPQSTAPRPACVPPASEPLTPRQRFHQAAFYARKVQEDAEQQAAYQAATDDIVRSAYTVAVADFLNAPNIRDVDLAAYHGQKGDVITVYATDDFAVHHVHLCIQNADGSLVEEGDAQADADGTTFRYTATQNNPSTDGDKITVTAYDNPGNATVEEQTL